MIIAHISDLHISRFGTSLVQMRALAREAKEDDGWEPLGDEEGWEIHAQYAKGRRFRLRDRLRLVDPDGTVHAEQKVPKGEGEQAVIDVLLALKARRVRVSSEVLAARLPTPAEIEGLLAEDPDNGNLRFCAVAHQLRADNPDVVLITGDLTDDAEGFELIEAGLAPFIDTGRMVCISGNHDIYPSPPLVTAVGGRKTEADKRRRWASFATRVGMPSGGSHLVDLGEGVLLACLDSCHPPKIPGSASGMVMLHELHHVAGALEAMGGRVKLACLHHHIANPPKTALGSTPFQAAMKLRNAKEVLELVEAMGVEVIMNGHRHLGYRYQPAGSPLFLSAPSTTMGCRSGAAPFYWRLSVGEEGVGVIREVKVEALAAGGSRAGDSA